MNGQVLLLQKEADQGADPGLLLHDRGFVVVRAAVPGLARELLQREPDLVLADVDLLEVPAWETAWAGCLETCRKRGIPCLLFSGSACLEALSARADGGDAVLLRPNSKAELARRVELLSSRRRLHQQYFRTRRRLRERDRQQAEELRSAAQIQQSLVPSHLPDMGSYRFSWCFEPFEKIGGDLFNVMQLDEDTVMAYLFDVSGHGVSSAMVSVSIYQSLSQQTGRIVKRVFVAPPYYKVLSPTEVLDELEREYPFERFEKFFTITYLLLSISSGRVRYSSAGHPPPVVLRKGGGVELLQAGGGLIGLGVGGPFVEGETTLGAGDRLYLYSDGVTEGGNGGGEMFGAERFFGTLQRLRDRPLAAGCDGVVEAVRSFAQGTPPQDDLTLLGIEFLGP